MVRRNIYGARLPLRLIAAHFSRHSGRSVHYRLKTVEWVDRIVPKKGAHVLRNAVYVRRVVVCFGECCQLTTITFFHLISAVSCKIVVCLSPATLLFKCTTVCVAVSVPDSLISHVDYISCSYWLLDHEFVDSKIIILPQTSSNVTSL
jgi:hypothetical protein